MFKREVKFPAEKKSNFQIDLEVHMYVCLIFILYHDLNLM